MLKYFHAKKINSAWTSSIIIKTTTNLTLVFLIALAKRKGSLSTTIPMRKMTDIATNKARTKFFIVSNNKIC